MPGHSRHEIFDESTVGVYHCSARCVRRAFLCGVDLCTNKNYEHRRRWIRERLEVLASVFAVEVGAYSVLNNHLHVLLRNRPDIVSRWSDEEVVRRWKRLSAKSLDLQVEPDEQTVNAALKQSDRVAELRRRLSHISWFMAMLNESVARAANAEDGCSGRFWEGRYSCRALTCEAAILACSVYIDLNLIRAMVAKTLETSRYCSAYDRIQDMIAGQADSGEVASTHRHSGWLTPLLIEGDGYDGQSAGRRASDKGLLPIPLEKYLEFADWSGRQLRGDKRGSVPEDLAPILERLGIQSENWLECVEQIGSKFGHVIGTGQQVLSHANRCGRKWHRGIAACRRAFKEPCVDST